MPSTKKITLFLTALRPLDALLPISIILQLDKAKNSLSLGLLLIWIAIRFVEPVLKRSTKKDSRHMGTAYAIFLGLLLFQSRAIVTHSDETGMSQYLMVAMGLAVGYSLSLKAWRSLLHWLNLATLVISITFLSNFRLEHDWLQDINLQVFNEGYGNINRLAVMFSLLTIASWGAARLSRRTVFQVLGGVGAGLGYLTCLATESRMATITPLVAVIASWLIIHGRTLLESTARTKLPLIAAISMIPLSTIWAFGILPDLDVGLSGDITRIRLIRCWAESIFSGSNRFLYGTGYNREKIMELCSDIKIGNISAHAPGSSGHAHNTYAHLTALHGLLGITAIIILAIIISRGMLQHIQLEYKLSGSQHHLPIPLRSFSWGDACLAINLTILFMSLSTTVHIYNHVNQLVIGLLLSASLAPTSES